MAGPSARPEISRPGLNTSISPPDNYYLSKIQGITSFLANYRHVLVTEQDTLVVESHKVTRHPYPLLCRDSCHDEEWDEEAQF